MSNPYDLEAAHRGGNIARSRSELKRVMAQKGISLQAELAAAERRGEQRILREVAKLPNPWTTALVRIGRKRYGPDVTEWKGFCEWCRVVSWSEREMIPAHPDNGCLWPRAQQAAQEQE